MDAAVIVAIIAAAVTFLAFLGDRYRDALARRRKLAAAALSDALLWLELPYRIRRRVDNDPPTLAALAERMHGLQERQVLHKSWLEVEIPAAHQSYVALLEAVKEQVGTHMRDAWESEPAARPELMNVGQLFEPDITAEVNAYVEATRQAVAFRLRHVLLGVRDWLRSQ